jgi:chromosome partitioning protein
VFTFSQEGGEGVIVAIVNLKGGVGKSTTAIYFATVASEGGEVVVLDADNERSAIEWAGSGELPFEVVPVQRDRMARQAREAEGEGRKVVIVDTPPNDREVLRAAASVADRVVVPVAPTGVDVNRLRATLEVLLDVEATRGELDTSILLTRWDGRKRLAREAEGLLSTFPLLEAGVWALPRYEDGFGGRPAYLEEYGQAWREVVGG